MICAEHEAKNGPLATEKMPDVLQDGVQHFNVLQNLYDNCITNLLRSLSLGCKNFENDQYLPENMVKPFLINRGH